MIKRILIVEDQEDLRGVLRDLLVGSGYAVVEAADGQVGVEKARSERPDLILMDIQLPVIDGYEATRQIKADPTLKATPVITVSSFAMKGDESDPAFANDPRLPWRDSVRIGTTHDPDVARTRR
jgi:two-component system cell cycle response regulator DivK